MRTARLRRPILACLSLTPARVGGEPVIANENRRQLSERERAVAQLRALATPYRFRVQADAEGFPIIPGRYGQIDWYCDGVNCAARFEGFCPLPGQFALAVYSDRPRLFQKIWSDSRSQATPDRRWRDARHLPCRSPGAGRQGHQGPVPALPGARGGPPAGVQAHTDRATSGP